MDKGHGSSAPAVKAAARPLSPHLQVFRFIITMAMSILHRITGAALYFGTLLIVWWLVATASGPAYFAFVNGLAGSWLGRLVLFGFSWALIHHALGGVRHFIWDMGWGYGPKARNWLAWANLFGSAGLTILLWIIAIAVA